MVELLLKKQDRKQCQLENQIQKQEQHLEQDTIALIQDLKQWQDTGLARSGKIINNLPALLQERIFIPKRKNCQIP